MLHEELVDLVHTIQRIKCETQTIEIKSAQDGCPKRLFDTLSSFSNQDEGGVILFGIDESSDYALVGVYDAQDLQKHLNEQCQQMEPPVRPLTTVAEIGDKVVVSAEIPGIDLADRPCFYKGKGRTKGSYKRNGESDDPMTEYEVYSYEAFRKKYQDDIRIIPDCDFSSLDQSALADYLLRLKATKPNLAKLDDERIYSLMSIKKPEGITLAAEWLFGLYPQAFIPQLCIIATKRYGTSEEEIPQSSTRFADNSRIEGTIPDMLDQALGFIRRNITNETRIDPETGKRTDVSALPVVAIREVILNALVHRDYSIHTEGMPIQVTLFSDRLEVTNPGGLYGRLRVDDLGKVQPDTRNPVLATAMETLGITENRYSGIPTIRSLMADAGLPQPEFLNTGSSFKVSLRMVGSSSNNSRSTNYRALSREESILDFCETPRTRNEIAEMLDIGASYAKSAYIQPLVNSGALLLELPNTPSSRKQRYYTAPPVG